MLDRFADSLHRIPGLSLEQAHEARRSAKLLRRLIESGARPDEAGWRRLFPQGPVRRLAQIHLDEGPGQPELDPEATLTGAEAARPRSAPPEPRRRSVEEQWYVLLTDIPAEGLPGPSGEPVDGWWLGRMVMAVSRGAETVDYQSLPVAGGFRDRFLGLARSSGRLECIRGLPRSAA